MSPTSERLYPAKQIAILAALLQELGISADDVLRGTGLDTKALRDTSCLTSIDQYHRICSNALGCTQDRSLSFRSGAQLHLSELGVFGVLLQSCQSVLDYCQLGVRYQALAAPSMAISWVETYREVICIWPDEGTANLPAELGTFLREQQAMQQVTQLRDLLGDCNPTLARFSYPAPSHRDLYPEHLGCPCVFDCERSELHYAKASLARRPPLANPQAAASLQSACEGLLVEMETRRGFAGKVYGALHLLNDPRASMKTVATALGMTDRTLRRRLDDEGTSFSAIANQFQASVAMQHLMHTRVSIDQIASIAGFSDPANFRRAFIRWTTISPAQYRRRSLG